MVVVLAVTIWISPRRLKPDATAGYGWRNRKGIALPILPWWNAVAINDVPAQSDFYSSANGRLLNDLVRDAREPEKVALLQKVWRQRLSYRPVRSAEESKIALSSVAETRASLPFISDELATLISQQGLESASTSHWRGFWNRCNWRWITPGKNRMLSI